MRTQAARRWSWLLAVVLMGSGRRTAVASPAAAAEAAIKRGIELRRKGDDVQALEEFKAACALARSPRALGQMGFAEQALGRWRDAEHDLDQALAPANAEDGWIKKNRATLERSRTSVAAHLGNLEILGGPDGAEIRVEGRLLGALPLRKPLRVPAGSVGVEVRADGFLATARSVTIAAGELTRETVSLQRISAPAAVSVAASSRTDGVGAPGLGARSSPPARVPSSVWALTSGPGDDDSGGGGRRTGAWVTGGSAVLFLGGFAASLLARNHYAGLVSARLGDGGCMQVGDQFRGALAPTCAAAATNRDRALILGIVAGGLAGAFAITSAILFATSSDSHGKTVACAPSLGASPMALAGGVGGGSGPGTYVGCHFWF